MIGAVKYALGNLTSFKGRDGRQTFGYLALFVFVLRTALGILVSVPMTIGMFNDMLHAIKSGASPEATNATVMAQMEPMLELSLFAGMASGVITVILLSAALVRRLHDSDLSGYWAWAAILPYCLNIALMPANMGRARAIMTTSNTPDLMITNSLAMLHGQWPQLLLGYVPYLIVILIAVRKSTPGPNRFGDFTVQF